MRKILTSFGMAALILGIMPSNVALAAGGLFDAMFEHAEDTYTSVYPVSRMEDYVILSMLKWKKDGILLTSKDIRAAVDQDEAVICDKNKRTVAGENIEFTAATCRELINDIRSLIQSEQEAVLLGEDLMMIANGAELAMSDEPNRPMQMPHIALLLRRVWSSTGAGVIPWKEENDPYIDRLKVAIEAESNIDSVVHRFRHGYFRGKREADPTLAGIGDPVKDALLELANALHITEDQNAIGEFAIPKLGGNIGVWARKDDLGLYWVYPTRFTYANILPAGIYPTLVPGGEKLSYPFSYKGSNAGANTVSPLCSHTTARQGYLCRSLPKGTPNCAPRGSDDNIELTTCSKTTERSDIGPTICKNLVNLYVDDGTPLTAANDFSRLNPALVRADTSQICTPETRVLYQDDIVSHACYIGHCLEQSMNGHSLIPSRNTTLVNEATSPYLACMRTDPQLGVFTEVAKDSPYPLPPYIGHELVQDFEQYFCGLNGSTAHPVLGYCRFRDENRAADPFKNQNRYIAGMMKERFSTVQDQTALEEAAMDIGYKAALTQTLEVNRKVFASLASLVQQIADLLGSLKQAPLTQAACPWTGPFTPAPVPASSSSSDPTI